MKHTSEAKARICCPIYHQYVDIVYVRGNTLLAAVPERYIVRIALYLKRRGKHDWAFRLQEYFARHRSKVLFSTLH